MHCTVILPSYKKRATYELASYCDLIWSHYFHLSNSSFSNTLISVLVVFTKANRAVGVDLKDY